MPQPAPLSKVRKAVSGQRQSASCRYMAGASTRRNNRYSAVWGILPGCCSAHFTFSPYLSLTGRQRHGQTVTHPALHRPSVLRRVARQKESLFLFARQPFVYPPEPYVRLSLSTFPPVVPVLWAIIPVHCSFSVTAWVSLGAKVGCRADSSVLKFILSENLPCLPSVFPHKKTTNGLFRRPCPAPQTPRRLSGEWKPTEGRRISNNDY